METQITHTKNYIFQCFPLSFLVLDSLFFSLSLVNHKKEKQFYKIDSITTKTENACKSFEESLVTHCMFPCLILRIDNQKNRVKTLYCYNLWSYVTSKQYSLSGKKGMSFILLENTKKKYIFYCFANLIVALSTSEYYYCMNGCFPSFKTGTSIKHSFFSILFFFLCYSILLISPEMNSYRKSFINIVLF